MSPNPAAAMATARPRKRKAMSPEHTELWKQHRAALNALAGNDLRGARKPAAKPRTGFRLGSPRVMSDLQSGRQGELTGAEKAQHKRQLTRDYRQELRRRRRIARNINNPNTLV